MMALSQVESGPELGELEARRLWAKTSLGRGLTLAEVGFLLGVSETRVQQIERRALGKLRAGLVRAGFSADDVSGCLGGF